MKCTGVRETMEKQKKGKAFNNAQETVGGGPQVSGGGWHLKGNYGCIETQSPSKSKTLENLKVKVVYKKSFH